MAKTKQLYGSASAIECADPVSDGCYRKWYGERVLKLPRPPQKATTFGDIIHEVCQRWLDADNNGRDLNGNEIELYPKGWEYANDKFSGKPATVGVAPEEQAIIKLLISKAIGEGILTRMPGRETERKINMWKVLPGILINGFIDLLEPDAIVDHKSTKDMKWAKSVKRKTKNSLYQNIQLNLYAYWKYTEDEYPKTERLKLRHNYFCHNKDKYTEKKVKGKKVRVKVQPHTEYREVYTTWPEVELFWTSRIEPVLKQMKAYIDNPDITFMDLPMPENPEASCRKYGDCQFTQICTGFETVNDYIRRMGGEVDKQNKEYAAMASQATTTGEVKMSENIVQKRMRLRNEALAAAKSSREGGTTSTAAPVVKEEVKEAAPVVSVSTTGGKKVAPWYQDGCRICAPSAVPGLRPDMTGPCLLCKMASKKNGGPVPEDYEWVIDEGEVIFVNKETGEEVVRQIVADGATAKQVTVSEEAPPEPELPAPPIVNEETKVRPAAVETPSAETPAVTLDTEAKGLFEDAKLVTDREKFELVIEAGITEAKVKGGGKMGSPSCIITGEELLAMVITHLSAVIGNQGGAAGWYGINAFTRKDTIAMYAPQIAEMLGSSTVVIARLGRATELEAIVSAVRPYARRVIQGLQG